MRKLWEDHITWTRLYIIEHLDATLAEAAARLAGDSSESSLPQNGSVAPAPAARRGTGAQRGR